MRGIILTIAVFIIVQTVVTVLPAKGNLVPQIVMISTLAVYDLTENPLLHHVADHQLIPAIATILKHHTRNSCLLRRVNQLPQLIQRVGSADLHGNSLAGFHSVDSRL